MPKVVVSVKEKILEALERRTAAGAGEDISKLLAELIDLGFEYRLRQLYARFEAGELSLEYFARELGLNLRELYASLEERGLPTSNIDARSTTSIR